MRFKSSIQGTEFICSKWWQCTSNLLKLMHKKVQHSYFWIIFKIFTSSLWINRVVLIDTHIKILWLHDFNSLALSSPYIEPLNIRVAYMIQCRIFDTYRKKYFCIILYKPCIKMQQCWSDIIFLKFAQYRFTSRGTKMNILNQSNYNTALPLRTGRIMGRRYTTV